MSYKYCDWQDILEIAAGRKEKPFILILDNIEDPRNFGAMLRTAESAGVHGVIIPKRRAVPVTDTVMRTSTGAAQMLAIAQVANINDVINRLKEEQVWIVGMEAEGSQDFKTVDYKLPIALVVGSEGNGISHLTKRNCDFLVRIPMKGQISSLNASVAAALLMYEVVRTRG